MTRIGRILATTIAVSVGILVLLGYFFDTLRVFSDFFIGWAAILMAFSLFLGVINLLRTHLTKIQTQSHHRWYSLILLLSLALTLIIGRAGPSSGGGQQVFEYVLRPLEASIFAMIIFFVASAAYRAFRVKNFETLLLVTFAIIVLLGQVPAGYQLWDEFPLVKEWVMLVPVLAGTRGILLGVALGVIATGLRIILAADRPYADGENKLSGN